VADLHRDQHTQRGPFSEMLLPGTMMWTCG
jgi:hypothetical protein